MLIQLQFNAARHAVNRSYAQMKRIFRKTVCGAQYCSSVACARMWSVFIFSLYTGLAIAEDQDKGPDMSAAPWESSLCGVAAWFQGPTMLAVGTIAFGVAGASFVFGEELNGILKRIVNITMGICLSVGGAALLGWIADLMGATATACSV